MSGYRAFPNTFHNDKWVVTFSNIPTVKDMNDMRYYDSYIKSVTLPDYNMEEIYSDGPAGFRIRHPKGGMWKNKDLSQLQIEFKLSEDMLNYLYLFNWMKQLRYGDIDSMHNDFFRKYVIKNATLSILDNQKRTIANLSFSNLFLLSLSSMPLTMGSSDEVTFTCNFSYEEISYELKNPLIGGSNPTTPSIVDPCGTSGLPISTSGDWN